MSPIAPLDLDDASQTPCLAIDGPEVLLKAVAVARTRQRTGFSMSVGFIQHGGVRILLMDFAGLKDSSAILARIQEALAFVALQPKKKELLTLVDLSLIRFDEAMLSAFRALNKHNEPWQRAVAVYGLTGLGLTVFRAQSLLMINPPHGFGDRDTALAWLVEPARRET